MAKLMNNGPVKLSKYFDYTRGKIKGISGDPEMREEIILYETKMLEREQTAGKAGYEQEKADSTRIILKNQLNNGKTLEQATELVRNLKLISDRELEKIIDLYK